MSQALPSLLQSQPTTGRPRGRKYLVFALASERFAMPLSQVKEVIGLPLVTPVPDVPEYFRGFINLRGLIISTIDLRHRLKIQPGKAPTRKPCVIVSEFDGVVLGSIVDDVCEVTGFDESQIERQLDIGSAVSRDYLMGVVRIEDKPLTVLLDIAKVLDVQGFAEMRRQAAKRAT